MASNVPEGEQCVDDLLLKLNTINELVERFANETKACASQPQDTLIRESREALKDTQHFINENKLLIPAYCLKKVSDSMRLLEGRVNSSTKTKLQFKFKSTPNKPVDSSDAPQTTSNKSGDIEATKSNNVANSDDRFYGFKNLKSETLVLEVERSESRDISLIDLTDCRVQIFGQANTVYIRDLTNTSVTVCLARRAITVIGCRSSQFNLICQQLRIDSTSQCCFSIYTSARSMLEASSELIFSPISLDEISDRDTASINRLMDENKFHWIDNNWKCIDDFDWLVPSSPSKNYKLVEP